MFNRRFYMYIKYKNDIEHIAIREKNKYKNIVKRGWSHKLYKMINIIIAND